MLFVWADVDPAHEQDYNRWYDREHVAERVSVPGMLSATRYRAASDKDRRYLGLYRSRDLNVFSSAAYQQVFQHQTPWSVENLGRMRNAVRRVASISAVGEGVGSWLVVARYGSAGRPSDGDVQKLSQGLIGRDGIISTNFLVPDTALSTPLPAESTEGRILDTILLVYATGEEAAKAAAAQLPSAGFKGEIVTLSMLWHLER